MELTDNTAAHPNPIAEEVSASSRMKVKFSRKNKAGFVLAILSALTDLPSVFFPPPEGQVGPPMAVLVLGAVCGLVTLGSVTYGWARHSLPAVRAAAGARIVAILLAMPALFVDGVPEWIRMGVAISLLVTIATVVLMLIPARRADA